MNKIGYVYIVASKKNGVLYVGVTSNLVKRIYQHKLGVIDSFTKRYYIKKLVYYEEYSGMDVAIYREKQIKGGSRKKKIELIEGINKEWKDLHEDIIE